MPYAMIWNTRLNVSKSGATNEAELKMGIAAKSLKAAVRFYQLAFSWLAPGLVGTRRVAPRMRSRHWSAMARGAGDG